MNAIYREDRLPEPIRIRGGLLDLNRRELIGPDQRRTAFGRVESVLLGRLVQTPSEYVSPDELLALLWPDDATKTHNSVQSVVARVRRVLRKLPDGDKLVQTGYGRGYRFVPPRSAVTAPVAEPSTSATPDLDALVQMLEEAPCGGLVHDQRVKVRAVIRAAVDRLPNPPKLRIVDLAGAQTATGALQRLATDVGADLRGLSLLRTQLMLISQILKRERNTLLVLLRPSPQVAAALTPLVALTEEAGALRLLVTSTAPIPCIMGRYVEVASEPVADSATAAEVLASRALVRCLRALDAGEYGHALSLVSDPAPLCSAVGLQVELLLARARAERALGLMRSALAHAEEAVVAAKVTPLQPLKRRAVGLRDALKPEAGPAFVTRTTEGSGLSEALRAVG